MPINGAECYDPIKKMKAIQVCSQLCLFYLYMPKFRVLVIRPSQDVAEYLGLGHFVLDELN